jgi:hypothetical protein
MNKRVIARLFGGLGNQLFIYAAARALAERTQSQLFLDTRSGFAGDWYERQFALHHFDIQYKEAVGAWRFDLPLGRELRYLSRHFNRWTPHPLRFHWSDFWEEPKRYLNDFTQTSTPPVVWMEGYWQAPAYFDAIRPILVRELRVKTPLSRTSVQLGEQIQNTNSICMHLRMLRNHIKGVQMSTRNEMDIQHYLKSMDYLAERIENAHFYCFSDNPDVMESIVKSPHQVTFVTHNRGDILAHEDFCLMSKCHHFILSNSTFGWWPAWLSEHTMTKVITPPLNYWDNVNILPENWLYSDQLNTHNAI